MADCVVVALGGSEADRIRRLWADLDHRWGVGRCHPTAEPHLTLVVLVAAPAPEALDVALTAIASSHRPFPVSGAGFGVFVSREAGEIVVHLALTRSPTLDALHAAVAGAVHLAGGRVEGQTDPRFWRPHITLADWGLSPRKVGGMMTDLLERGPRHWTVEVDNISLVSAGVMTRYPFTGGGRASVAGRVGE